jgi:3-oxoacyl-[acyl-carrier-protein] synthase-1/3-oxoacyl-[acyl-carrier-protein] synthase II
MSSVAIFASGAISALGRGSDAISAGEAGAPARVAIARDDELVRAGLARPFAARAWPLDDPSRAAGLLRFALNACTTELDERRPGWRGERVGLVVGTSSGGMRAAERSFAEIAAGARVTDPAASTYSGPLDAVVGDLAIDLDPCVLVLGACASAVLAIGLGTRWLERGACDVVLAGGFDEVTVFVAAGFEVLRATTASPPPRPFRLGRDGMSLGEGAAIVALVREAKGQARAFVTGFGAASDAVHLTAPDRDGKGLARAGQAALMEAGAGSVDLVSAHATATPFNDAAEAKAIRAVLGAGSDVVVHPFKAQAGHTLGAAGALELLVGLDAMERGVVPAAAGQGLLDPDASVRLLARAQSGPLRRVLKLASAFGGSNAALVLSREAGTGPRRRRPAFLHQAVHAGSEGSTGDLAARTGFAYERVERADRLVRLALAAIAALASECGPLDGAGLVVGTAMGPIENNASFAARLREGGVRLAEPRRFAYTSPNTAAGECSIAFGLSGPSFAVGGGMHAAVEALAAGALLVESGDAERVVVVAVDDAGPVTLALAGDSLVAGAVACLVSAGEGAAARARIGALSLRRGGRARPVASAGHLALLPLVGESLPTEVAATSPPDITARVSFEV